MPEATGVEKIMGAEMIVIVMVLGQRVPPQFSNQTRRSAMKSLSASKGSVLAVFA
jgi:hypothetical protein